MHGHGMGAVGYYVATYIYKKKKDDSNVATDMNYGVVSFQVGFNLYVILE
jgi:ketopantoate reductase